MALIKCPECGKEISEKAVSCPNCGCPSSEFQIRQITINTSTNKVLNQEAPINNTSNSTNCRKCGKPTEDNLGLYCKECYEKIQSFKNNINEGKQNKQNANAETGSDRLYNSKISIVALVVSILGALSAMPFLIVLAFVLCAVDYLRNPFKRKYTVLYIALVFSVLGCISCAGSSKNRDTQSTTITDDAIHETETLDDAIGSETAIVNVPESETPSPEVLSNIAPIEIYYADFIEHLDDYIGMYITTSFPVNNCDNNNQELEAADINNSGIYMKVYPDNYQHIDYDEFVTVTGLVTAESSRYPQMINAHIEEIGDDAAQKYDTAKAKYDEIKKQEAEEYEKKFREKSISVSYDELSRYPDTYKTTAIKLKVKITDVEPDGIILPGHYEATIFGTSQKISVYDDRELQEPKLLKGDIVTIYGYGNGLTTIKVQDTSGLVPKTVDKYTIPSNDIKYVDIN